MKKRIPIVLLITLGVVQAEPAIAGCQSEAFGGSDWEVVLGPDSGGTIAEKRACNSCFSVEAETECFPMGEVPCYRVSYFDPVTGRVIVTNFDFCQEHATFGCL